MLQLMIDESNNRIFGYMDIDKDSTLLSADDIVIENEDDIKTLTSSNLFDDKIYYIDGHVIKDNSGDVYSDRIELLEGKIAELEKYQNTEALFNLIMEGKSMDDAVFMIKEKKNELEEKKMELENLYKEIEEKRKQYWKDKMDKEEEGKNYKYYISIMLIAKDENEYIEEWIEHHLSTLGVDHIYLYDNESKVPIKEYLEEQGSKYMDKITFVDWASTESNQEDSLNHFLKTYGDETKWVITIDVDEFIVMNDTSRSLHSLLESYESEPYILCQWVHYGANGNETKSNEPVMERFTQRAETLDTDGLGKYFVQTGKCNRFTGRIHVRRRYCELYINDKCNLDLFQVNHYITKSFEEWDEKMKKGSVSPIHGRNYSLFFEVNPDMKHLDTGENYKQGYGASHVEE